MLFLQVLAMVWACGLTLLGLFATIYCIEEEQGSKPVALWFSVFSLSLSYIVWFVAK